MEYSVVAFTASEVAWVQTLLHKLHQCPSSAPNIMCDNIGTTYAYSNPFCHSRMKHVSTDLYFFHGRIAKGKLCVVQVSIHKRQLVDVLIKPLSRQILELLRSKMGVSSGSSVLRGRVNNTKYFFDNCGVPARLLAPQVFLRDTFHPPPEIGTNG